MLQFNEKSKTDLGAKSLDRSKSSLNKKEGFAVKALAAGVERSMADVTKGLFHKGSD